MARTGDRSRGDGARSRAAKPIAVKRVAPRATLKKEVAVTSQPGREWSAMPLQERAERQKFYASAAWKAVRKQVLARDWHCVLCASIPNGNQYSVSTVVNHKKPLKMYPELALDLSNLEGICKACHDKVVQKAERKGISSHDIGCDEFGFPVGRNHHWNK